MQVTAGDFSGYKANLNFVEGKFAIDFTKRKNWISFTRTRFILPDDLASFKVINRELRRVMLASQEPTLGILFVMLIMALFTPKLLETIMPLLGAAYLFFYIVHKEEWVTVAIKVKSGQEFTAGFGVPEWKNLEKFATDL
jgi:hypothetical protein